MCSNTDDDDDLAQLIQENSRRWQSYWYWRDKPVGERQAALKVLTEAGFEVTDLSSRKEDPPDCEASINGSWWGIEVTELLHRPALEQSIQALRARQAGREPEKPEGYFAWDRDSLLAAVQELIEWKDKAKLKGGRYERYILVIVTDEFFLDRHTVEDFLREATFQADLITDVLLGLSYHPSLDPRGGSCPVFRLRCGPRSP